MAKISVIGSGFSGISAAAYCAAGGHEVHVFEKNNQIGGRARQLITDSGYVFDMGPSWYWMPDVYEQFFSDFNAKVSDYYDLQLLDPSFDIVFGPNDVLHIPSNFTELCACFETIEIGSADKLKTFMKHAESKYKLGIGKLVHKPGLSLFEFLDLDLFKGLFYLNAFTNYKSYVRSYFKHPKLIALMEFPILFLGAKPKDTPALYSLMNYSGLTQGTWYPIGGFGKVVQSMQQLAEQQGVQFHTNSPVQHISAANKHITGITANGINHTCDAVIASADYQHVDSQLLDKTQNNYSEAYWNKRVFAPSCLIFYIGINKKLNNIHHHTLFFEYPLDQHAEEIYTSPKWPRDPLFYVCCPSVTDNTVAPAGHENIFILMPVAVDLEDTQEMREYYFNKLMKRLESYLQEDITSHIDFLKSYSIDDFKLDYNAYKGNAYGLANTIFQTANLKPSIKNKHIQGLYYTGQLTVPGPGVPPAIISGKLVAKQLLKDLAPQT